jgi:hypothetical protein
MLLLEYSTRGFLNNHKSKNWHLHDIELDTNRDNYIDPYENFHWGGLSGEEAFIGYWNTE